MWITCITPCITRFFAVLQFFFVDNSMNCLSSHLVPSNKFLLFLCILYKLSYYVQFCQMKGGQNRRHFLRYYLSISNPFYNKNILRTLYMCILSTRCFAYFGFINFYLRRYAVLQESSYNLQATYI